MSSKQFKILSTRPLSQNIVEEATLKNVLIDEVEFITTKAISDDKTITCIKTYLQQPHTAVFTSMNAVEAVAAHIKGGVDWKIYCMGNTTKNLVHKYFGNVIAGIGYDAIGLARAVVANKENEVVFFCGDQRRDELPVELNANNINVTELLVYNTIALNKTVTQHYDGILFYSPSAVESFFKNNTLSDNTILFAIGETTAATIKTHTSNQIIISDEPGKDKLADKAISFFYDKIQLEKMKQ